MGDLQPIITLISMASAVGGIIFGVCTVARASRTQHNSDGERTGSIMTELGYIKSGIDTIQRRQEKTDEQVMSLVTRVTSVEASAKQAHHRLDRIEGKEDRT